VTAWSLLVSLLVLHLLETEWTLRLRVVAVQVQHLLVVKRRNQVLVCFVADLLVIVSRVVHGAKIHSPVLARAAKLHILNMRRTAYRRAFIFDSQVSSRVTRV